MIPQDFKPRLGAWSYGCAGLVALFCIPLYQLVRFCLAEDLFSYILLIPAVSVWLVWQQRATLKYEFSPAPLAALGLALTGVALLAASFPVGATTEAVPVNALSLRILAFVAGLVAVSFWFLGGGFMRQLLFPAGFLVFMTPLPPALVAAIEVGLQLASADVSAWFFAWTGASFLRDGLVFYLPNIVIQVAPECSGIRSTIVLFITSLIAGYLFLRHPWQRTLFTALVIPLGVARNALRIVTIGWLCIEYGPQMIRSPVHHSGGPVFFALSLVPLFALLWIFRRMNRRSAAPPVTAPKDGAEMAGAVK